MKADFQEKKDEWRCIKNALGWMWWNYGTGECEPSFWIGLLKKLKILK